MTRLVIGWGNPLAGDDGIGIRAARLASERLAEDVSVIESSHAGLRLAEQMLGYARVIVADVHVGAWGSEVKRNVIHPQALSPLNRSMRHDGTLKDALRVMRAMRATDLPEEIVLLSVSAPAPEDWQAALSARGERAAKRLADAVLDELEVRALV